MGHLLCGTIAEHDSLLRKDRDVSLSIHECVTSVCGRCANECIIISNDKRCPEHFHIRISNHGSSMYKQALKSIQISLVIATRHQERGIIYNELKETQLEV